MSQYKKNILEIIQLMLYDYCLLENYNKKVALQFIPSFNRGFCHWLYIKAYSSQAYYAVLFEMQKDLLEPVENYKTDHWYKIFIDVQDYDQTITPRINHLKRSIAWLEKEIQLQPA